jgi:uncharacterized membrane protein YoaK (UPF0700 family)
MNAMRSTQVLRRLVTISLTLCFVVAVVLPEQTLVAHPEYGGTNLERVTLNAMGGVAFSEHKQPVDVSGATQLENPPKAFGHPHHQKQHTSTRLSNKSIFCMSIAFITGCVDTVSYHRYKCYVNMMTGNVVRFATSVAESQWADALFHISLITSYVVGVGLFRIIEWNMRDIKATDESNHELLVVVAPLIVTLFILADVVAHFVANERKHAPILSLGFGIINAASGDATGGTILYAMTGHINRMGRTLVDYLVLSKGKCYKSFKSHLRIVTCFAAGIALSVKAAQYLLPLMSSFQPPMATTFGLLFAALFIWYGTAPAKSHSST